MSIKLFSIVSSVKREILDLWIQDSGFWILEVEVEAGAMGIKMAANLC